MWTSAAAGIMGEERKKERKKEIYKSATEGKNKS